MKKIAPYIRNKQGSMLMLTLIVFMVILILGMTMITSMLYSQGENNMQINEQKAYYAAQSAVEAVKSYFLNPDSKFITTTSIKSPQDLIDATGTYTLKAQGIDEDTTVSISITRQDGEANENSKKYILIEATGTCQGEQSTVRARLIEEVKQGASGGLYDSQVVFGTSNLQSSKDMTVIGNIYIEGDYAATINNLQMKETTEQKSALYIKNKSSLQLDNNEFKDVYIDTESTVTVINNHAENMYIRCIGNNAWQQLTFINNTVKGDAQLYLGGFSPNMNSNIINGRFILGFNRDTLGNRIIVQNKAKEFYIKGVGKFTNDDGVDSTSGVGDIYIDDNTQVSESFKLSYQLTDLSNLFASEEQRISTVISGLSEVGTVLKTKPSWDKEAVEENYQKVLEGQGVLKKDPANIYFDEYYDTRTNTRWVFPGYNPWYTPSTYTIKSGSNNSGYASADTYYISNDPMHKNDTIFFINDNGDDNSYYSINMSLDSNQKLENFYIYAPYFNFKFMNDFEYFSGSIIAKSINAVSNGPKEIEFKAPDERIEITGAPSTSGDSNNAGSSSGTTYIYKFESYIDKEVS